MSQIQYSSMKRGSDSAFGDRPNKLTKKARPSNLESSPRPIRPTLRRSGSTRSIFAGALDIFSRRSTIPVWVDKCDEEATLGLAKEPEESSLKFRLSQMPSLLSLSSMIRGASSRSSASITPSPTTASFFPSSEAPALSPTDSQFSSSTEDSLESVSTSHVPPVALPPGPIDLPFSPTFVRGRDEWSTGFGIGPVVVSVASDESSGDKSEASIDASSTPVVYEGVWGNVVSRKAVAGDAEERARFLTVG
ncbi:hypothetical protein JCM10212_000621 [Sporobolomyces blumeae]